MPRLSAYFCRYAAGVFLAALGASAYAQVDGNVLISSLTGKTVIATVELAYSASVEHPVIVNGRPAMFPAKTLIYPDGHLRYRVESGLLHAEADKYVPFKTGIQYKINKVELKDEFIELKMPSATNAKQEADVKVMLGKGWQQTMTTEKALSILSSYLPDTEMLAKKQADAEARRAEDAKQAQIAAAEHARQVQIATESARKAAEEARAAAQAKADALAAEHRAETEKKIDQAILTKAKAGDAEAQYLVGRAYSYGTGGAEKNDMEAVYWFRKSAEQGNPKGENALGVSYEYGSGIGKNYAQAIAWLRKAADQEYPKAEDNLGDAYYNGWGTQMNLPQAFDLYQKAATSGDVNAEFSLGYMYANGDTGTPDFTQAVSWYRKSAEQGNDSAQNNLGLLYANGQGVPRNEILAKSWYQKAANQGNSQAKSNLDKLQRAAELAVHPPQVSDHDGFAVFRDQIYDYEQYHLQDLNVEANPVDLHPYNAHNEVRAEYRASQTDQQRALLLALIAIRADVTFTPKFGNPDTKQFDGADLADLATSEAVATYPYQLWRAETEAQRNVEGLNAAVTKYSEWTISLDGKRMPLNRAIATSANDLLRAAYSGPHRTGDLGLFITTYVIPSGEGTAFSQIKAAAVTLGIR